MNSEQFDVAIVGSGFGGSVATCRLAEGGMSVCLLERGRSYPPGSFPRSPANMRDNFWDPSEKLYGLFDAWSFRKFEALVASGLGGGSLIYANVLIRKDEKWFVDERRDGSYEPWPVTRSDLDPHYDEVERRLSGVVYPLEYSPYSGTAKTLALRECAIALGRGDDWQRPKLAVTFSTNPDAPPVPGEPILEPYHNLHNRTRYTCRLCGECDIGCNYGSKNTLDYTYLSDAKRAGAEIREQCEVRSLESTDRGWAIGYVRHDPTNPDQRSRDLPIQTIHASRLVLGAGTFGSVYLLLSNRDRIGSLSAALGTRFSGNGDLLGICTKAKHRSQGIPRRLDPDFGPVITSAIRVPDLLDGGSCRGFYVEDGGFPALASWIVETLQVPGAFRRATEFAARWIRNRLSNAPRSRISGELRRALGDTAASSSTLVMLGMGRDKPGGEMRLNGRYLDVSWSKDDSREYFDRVRDLMREVAQHLRADFRDNPLWYFKRVVTVHPLGGCPMGSSPARGVVSQFGEVFGQKGLYVVDGSVMPGPVGPNPSLTIAAFANRAAEHILQEARIA